ncbi:MAG: hypothetical protein N2F24_14690, partial [Deltaproteobacteria bacterium]
MFQIKSPTNRIRSKPAGYIPFPGFGYTRIIGELRKLGIKKISRQTVRNILKEEGIEPGPDRTSD